jgi:hypothetical protein
MSLSPQPTTHSSTRESYKFRQASDFWYLTGFEEPDSALILGKSIHLISRHHNCASPHTVNTRAHAYYNLQLIV